MRSTMSSSIPAGQAVSVLGADATRASFAALYLDRLRSSTMRSVHYGRWPVLSQMADLPSRTMNFWSQTVEPVSRTTTGDVPDGRAAVSERSLARSVTADDVPDGFPEW
jgi:hypothetical protein